jgi:intein/homing endonuclease
VIDSLGNELIVTEDHAMIVLEDGKLVEKSPMELKKGEKILTIKHK